MNKIINFESDNPDKILRPLSTFSDFDDKDTTLERKIGLALCHGHNHKMDQLLKINNIDKWYMVDRNKKCCPDYVADVSSKSDMKYFKSNSFDCVMTIFCPVYRRNLENLQYPRILKIMHRIVKKNGFICLTELPGLFLYFVNDYNFDKIVGKIIKCLGQKNIDDYRSCYIQEKIAKAIDNYRTFCIKQKVAKNISSSLDSMPIIKPFYVDATYSEKHFYYELVVNYDGPRREYLKRYLNKISIKHTIDFLEKNNFSFVEISNDVLFAKPINKF
jgi:hypothetical protein